MLIIKHQNLLSQMARGPFSLQRRRRLTTDMVEVISCIKDWELANHHKQDIVEKETNDLEATFEAMYLLEVTIFLISSISLSNVTVLRLPRPHRRAELYAKAGLLIQIQHGISTGWHGRGMVTDLIQ